MANEDESQLEVQLLHACESEDYTTLFRLLESVNEDTIIAFAVQQRQHLVLEDVVKYLMMLLSRQGSDIDIDLNSCNTFLVLVSR